MFIFNKGAGDVGWLRLVASLKIYVSFAKEPHKRDLYSAKRPKFFREPTNRRHSITHLVMGYVAMGWQRCICSVKFQVSFAKEPYICRALLQKRLMFLVSLQNVSTYIRSASILASFLHFLLIRHLQCKYIYIYIYSWHT